MHKVYTAHGDERHVTVTINGESRVLGHETAQRLVELLDAEAGVPAPFSAPALASFEEAEGAKPLEVNDGAIVDIARRVPIPNESDLVALGPEVRKGSRPLDEVLEARRSRRWLTRPDLGDLATLLVRSGRVVSWSYDGRGLELSLRPYPSAGALHPLTVELLASEVTRLDPGSWMFDPMRCSLVRTGRTQCEVDDALGAIALAAATEPAPAALVILANPAKTLSRYPQGTSLIWRETGALLATLHLVATDLGLASSIIGTSGVLDRFRPTEFPFVDVGALIVGVARA